MIRNPITSDILPVNWKLVSVDEIKSTEKYSCVAGPFGSDISSQYFKDEGVPVIRGNNLSLTNEKFHADGFVFVSKERAASYKAQHVKANDLIFTCWGTIGQVGIIPEDGPHDEYIISNKQLKLRVNVELVNPQFLYYYFSSKAVFQYLNNIAIGSAVPGINLGILKRFPVALPPKKIQDNIAALLDSFFQLIENNKQRITLLEEMAEEIYKEWFVRFRFPGYESTKFLNEHGKEVAHGTVGALPEGWEKVKAETTFDINIGKTPPREESQWFTDGNNGMKWVSIRDIGSCSVFLLETSEEITADGISRFNMRVAKKDTVILSFKLTVGKIAILNSDMVTNEAIAHFNIRDGNEMNREYIYCYLKNFQFGELGNTSSIGNAINSKIVKEMPIVRPSKIIVNIFGKVVYPMLEEVKILSLKNQLLQQTRDLLLPRLISGKLSVAHLLEAPEEALPLAAEPAARYGK